jgi:hypothetical protein
VKRENSQLLPSIHVSPGRFLKTVFHFVISIFVLVRDGLRLHKRAAHQSAAHQGMDANYRTRTDIVALRKRALELEKALGSNDLHINEALRLAEELETVLARLDALQTVMDEYAVSRTPIASAEPVECTATGGPVGGIGRGGGSGAGGDISTFRALTKAFQASTKPSDAAIIQADVMASRLPPKTLGKQLVEELREQLAPVLADQLKGLDSPISPPQASAFPSECPSECPEIATRLSREARDWPVMAP